METVSGLLIQPTTENRTTSAWERKDPDVENEDPAYPNPDRIRHTDRAAFGELASSAVSDQWGHAFG